jgi:hypothetical protein
MGGEIVKVRIEEQEYWPLLSIEKGGKLEVSDELFAVITELQSAGLTWLAERAINCLKHGEDHKIARDMLQSDINQALSDLHRIAGRFEFEQ